MGWNSILTEHIAADASIQTNAAESTSNQMDTVVQECGHKCLSQRRVGRALQGGSEGRAVSLGRACVFANFVSGSGRWSIISTHTFSLQRRLYVRGT